MRPSERELFKADGCFTNTIVYSLVLYIVIVFICKRRLFCCCILNWFFMPQSLYSVLHETVQVIATKTEKIKFLINKPSYKFEISVFIIIYSEIIKF